MTSKMTTPGAILKHTQGHYAIVVQNNVMSNIDSEDTVVSTTVYWLMFIPVGEASPDFVINSKEQIYDDGIEDYFTYVCHQDEVTINYGCPRCLCVDAIEVEYTTEEEDTYFCNNCSCVFSIRKDH